LPQPVTQCLAWNRWLASAFSRGSGGLVVSVVLGILTQQNLQGTNKVAPFCLRGRTDDGRNWLTRTSP
jgi:hypothetical protein